jgi:hypothetical protein
MTSMKRIALAALLLALCSGASAQPAPAPATPQSPPPAAEPKDDFPTFNIYLPEGEVDLRVRKLIRNVLFESQIDYRFAEGDVSTFLRYKYYANAFTYKIGVFDTLEFASVQSGSNDFDRVRGGLIQFEYPQDYDNRYFLLVQHDKLTFGDVTRPDNNHRNFYGKIGYQFGTPFDERLNAIVAESRGRIPPVLTAYREIGPQNLGIALAATQAAGFGDYKYTKLEGEALKRFDVSETSFVFTRLHVGTFLDKRTRPVPAGAPDYERYDIPGYEFFKLGGRGQLKAVDDNERGSDEIHLTNEYFLPLFRNRDYRLSVTHWHNLYGIGYIGAGSLGFDKKTFTDLGRYVVDAGLGFESSLTVRRYEVYLTMVYARTLRAPSSNCGIEACDKLDGHALRFSVRTSR